MERKLPMMARKITVQQEFLTRLVRHFSTLSTREILFEQKIRDSFNQQVAVFMEEDTLLEVIYENEAVDYEDVEMVDVEDGQELSEHDEVVTGKAEGVDSLQGKTEDVKTVPRKKRRKRSGKRNKNLNSAIKDESIAMNRFVLETSRRLNEKKIHLVREAVNYLGLAAVKDLVSEGRWLVFHPLYLIRWLYEFNYEIGVLDTSPERTLSNGGSFFLAWIYQTSRPKLIRSYPSDIYLKVDTVQNCGGQMTFDGTRQRTGGGILWNILRLRDRKAYKEIMARGKKFMRQRKQVQVIDKLQKEPAEIPNLSDAAISECLKNSSTTGPVEDEPSKHDTLQDRVSVWHRVRVPVSYSDLVEDGTEEGHRVK